MNKAFVAMCTGLLVVLACAAPQHQQQQGDTTIFSPLLAALHHHHNSDQRLISMEASSHHSDQQARATHTPTAGQCFLWLTGSFAILTVLIYAVQLTQHTALGVDLVLSKDKIGEKTQLIKSAFERAFNPAALASARNVLSAIPILSVLLIYLMFRARVQNIPEDDSDYVILQHGMIVATVGLMIQVLDALSFRLQSEVFGNLSVVAGNILVTAGAIMLVWGVFAVRSSYQSIGVSGKCLVAVCVLSLAVLISLKTVQFVKSFNPYTLVPQEEGGLVRDLVSDRWLEDVQSAISFGSLLAIAFLYSYFFHTNASYPSTTETSAMTACCVTLYTQVLAVLCGLSPDPTLRAVGGSVRAIATVGMYASFVVLVYVLVAQHPTSPATWNVLIILMAVSVIRLVIVSLQEAAGLLLQDINDECPSQNSARVLAIIKMFQNMSVAASLAEVLSLLFLYVHFRVEYMLNEQPAAYMQDVWYLAPTMYLTTVTLFCQIGVLVAGFFLGEDNRVLAVANSVCLATMNTCLLFAFIGAIA
eukprot:c5540_g1_i1.p1 GENE.c5540_g1_i1~~c5540_g1_i1.p1  ORF type:complete len:531 (+),score=163.17 c5540_g1_i1:54-1646(+)